MSNYRIKEDNTVEFIDSCGCMFCDMGDKPRDYKGRMAHYHYNGTIMYCLRDTPQTSKRLQ